MQRLASEAPIRNLDHWLQNVVAGVLQHSDVISVNRAELWALLDSLPVAILISTDRECTKIVGNVAAGALLNAPRGRNLSQSAPQKELPPFKVFVDGKPALARDLPMQLAARTGRPVARSECEIKFSDESSVFIAGHSIPIKNENDEVCGSIGAFVDISATKLEIDRAEIIAGEANHRLMNTISLVQSISRQTLKPKLGAGAYDDFEARLIAIGRFQELTYSAHGGKVLLAEIVHTAVAGVVGTASGRVSFDGPTIFLAPEAAFRVSMILHELATNACKYGALSRDGGSLVIHWQAEVSDRGVQVVFDWSERSGPIVTAPQRSGFGTKMMRTVAKELPRGQINLAFNAHGLKARLGFAVGDPSDTAD